MKTHSEKTPVSGAKFTKKINMQWPLLALAIALVMSSCQEESVAPANDLEFTELAASPVAGGSAVTFTVDSTYGTIQLDNAGVYAVENFFQGVEGATEDDPHEVNEVYYFDFTINDGGSSSDYVMQFSGTANADLSVNTGDGYSLSYTSTAFDNVTSSTTTTAVSGSFGYNRIGLGTSLMDWTISSSHPGWYNYDLLNHVVYPLVENGTDITLVITNGTVTYAVEMQDLYEDGTPNSSSPPDNYPYFTFRYKTL